MPELERMLASIGEELDWPETPDVAGRVVDRLELEEERPGGRRAASAGALRAAVRRPRFGLVGARRSLVLAALVLLLLAGTVFAAVPAVRHAVLDLFGLRGATVERRETLPTPPPERPLDLGTRTTLAAAGGTLGFEPLLPTALGAPDGVYVREGVPGGELSLTYRSRPGLPRAGATRLGLLVSEFRGDIAPEYVGKLAGQGTRIERLTIDGERALWLAGAPHFLLYRDPDGNVVEGTLRLAHNVLLLERGRLLVRIEGAIDRERAISIARSLR